MNSVIMLPLEKFLDPSNRFPILLTSAGMIAAIAFLDWLIVPYVSLGFLYLFPIMLVAGFVPRWVLVTLAVVCAILSETFSSLDPQWRISRLFFETLALTGYGLFISEMIRNRRSSLETQQRLRALVETSPAAIVTIDESGIIELANEAAAELLIPETSVVGQPIVKFLPELQNALRAESEAQFRASMQCPGHRANGDSFVAEVWFSTYTERRAPKLAAIIADISEEQLPSAPPLACERDGGKRPSLNSRQTAVLRLVLEGLQCNEIAARLQMTTSAAKNTLQQVYSKAGVHNRSQMVRFALEHYRDLL